MGDDGIRVMVRFRPLVEREKGGKKKKGKIPQVWKPRNVSNEKVKYCNSISVPNPGGEGTDPMKWKRTPFTFDRVFDEKSTQEEVYERVGRPLVNEVARGYNCTLMAYGQTGCLAPRTQVKMYAGGTKSACDIVVGDVLVGDDRKPRHVLKLFSGVDSMYRISSEQPDEPGYVVNQEHILTLDLRGDLVDIKVTDYLALSMAKRRRYRGVRVGGDKSSRYGIRVTTEGFDEYFGFMLDENHRFLLWDGTVTHNSGKTHSMMGYHDRDSTRNHPDTGIIPRVIRDMFLKMEEEKEAVDFSVCVSYVEIYNEQINDLLDTTKTKLELHESRDGRVYIKDCTETMATTCEDVLHIIVEGEKNRKVASTKMNDTSSRSHAVLILKLTQENRSTATKKFSRLFLVDLAGSEQVKRTGATGQTFKEATHVNGSLSALNNVISALTEKSDHVPYRNSHLTRMLSDSLGGNSKTVLLMACSPAFDSIRETHTTLRFGSRAKKIKNRPTVNKEISKGEFKRLLREMKSEMAGLQSDWDKAVIVLQMYDIPMHELRAIDPSCPPEKKSLIPRKREEKVPKEDEDLSMFQTDNVVVFGSEVFIFEPQD